MNVSDVVKVFSKNQITGQSLIMETLKTIKDFERRIKLIPTYDELNRINELYIEQRNETAKGLAQKYCDEQNEINKDVKEFKPLTTEIINEVPEEKKPEFFKRLSELENAKVELKEKLKFTKEEIRESDIDIEKILLLREFIINFDKDFC